MKCNKNSEVIGKTVLLKITLTQAVSLCQHTVIATICNLTVGELQAVNMS